MYPQSYVVDLHESLHSATPQEEIPVTALGLACIFIHVHQQ